MRESTTIRRRALRLFQHPKHPLYLFTLSAEELLQVADISRVSRDEAGKLIGYQRPEVRKHVRGIVEYLDSGDVLFPNSVILALTSAATFREVRGPKVDEGLAEAGTIEIPVERNGGAKPAWIVDGQQRALALSRCRRKDFLVPVNAFVADDLGVQKEAASLGMWLFLVTEVMFFGGLFLAYTVYRNLYPEPFALASHHLNVRLGAVNTAVLICSSLTMAMAVHGAAIGRRRQTVLFLILTVLLACLVLVGRREWLLRLLARRRPSQADIA